MKKIGKINLVSMENKQFSDQELVCIKGGYSNMCCGCGCPSSNDYTNQNGNFTNGYSSSIGGEALWCYENMNGIPGPRLGDCGV